MSLLKTLAKVAIGVAVAKGVGGMMKGRAQQTPSPGQASGGASGGLGDLLGQLTGGGSAGGQPGGGLGDLLGQLAGGAAGQRGGAAPRSGGNDGIMPPGYTENASAGAGSSGGLGGLGELLGGLAGQAAPTRSGGGSFGDLLNSSISNQGEPDVAPTASEEMTAGLLLRAMVQATKADGQLDDTERGKLMEHLEDASDQERAFVNAELAAPIDIAGLAGQVPAGMEQQVYAMSLLVIELDDQSEAQYLHELAGALGLQQQIVNDLHDQVGAQRLYS